MTALRVLPPLMVAGGVCMLGFSLAGVSRARVTALQWLLDAMQLLSGYVNHYGLLLRDALLATARDMGGEAAAFLEDAAARMDGGAQEAFTEALSGAAKTGGNARALSDADKRAVERFAARFMKGREECETAFVALINELTAHLNDARAAASRDGRMYRSLGILAAIASGILLL